MAVATSLLLEPPPGGSLIAFAKAFEADLPATILVVLHVPASGASALPDILERFGNLPVDIAAPQQRVAARADRDRPTRPPLGGRGQRTAY